MRFTYEPHAIRVVFGRGASKRVAEEVVRIGRRALVLSTPEQSGKAKEIARELGELAVGVFAGAGMHVPGATADEAAEVAARQEADCTIALGGGSTIGLGKALALRQSLPTLAVPTTYAGSEVTPIWGLTEDGVKTTGRDPKVLPRIVIYDADLVDTLPPGMTVASGLNAIAHAMEGLYAIDGNPIISLMAEESLRAPSRSLPRIAAGGDADARDDALYGSWLAGPDRRQHGQTGRGRAVQRGDDRIVQRMRLREIARDADRGRLHQERAFDAFERGRERAGVGQVALAQIDALLGPALRLGRIAHHRADLPALGEQRPRRGTADIPADSCNEKHGFSPVQARRGSISSNMLPQGSSKKAARRPISAKSIGPATMVTPRRFSSSTVSSTLATRRQQ